MKIEKHYPDRKSLAQAEEPYKEALLVLNTLYMFPPKGGAKTLSTKDVVDYYVMSCVHTIVDMLTENVVSFPSIFNYCKRYAFVQASSDSMSFDNFYVNADYECAALFGAVYYVLARQQKVDQVYLDYIEQCVSTEERLKCYFLPFKDAAVKKNAEKDDISEKDKNGKVKGLTTAQAGLFCESLLAYHRCTYSNKKETIAPLANSLFGWAPSTMERNVSSHTKDDREYVAKLFETIDPEFCSFVKNYGNKYVKQTKQGDSMPDGK